jgi:hypothetical protein
MLEKCVGTSLETGIGEGEFGDATLRDRVPLHLLG